MNFTFTDPENFQILLQKFAAYFEKNRSSLAEVAYFQKTLSDFVIDYLRKKMADVVFLFVDSIHAKHPTEIRTAESELDSCISLFEKALIDFNYPILAKDIQYQRRLRGNQLLLITKEFPSTKKRPSQ